MNNDGRSDFAVGAAGEGRVYITSGANGGVIYTLTTPNASLSGGSNFDGDGRGDLVVGDPTAAVEELLRQALVTPTLPTRRKPRPIQTPTQESPQGPHGASRSGPPGSGPRLATLPPSIKRWSAPRKLSLAIRILCGEISEKEAADRYGVARTELRGWVTAVHDDALQRLRRKGGSPRG